MKKKEEDLVDSSQFYSLNYVLRSTFAKLYVSKA
jgi:hypothetical protein